jgi:hypothetical protein
MTNDAPANVPAENLRLLAETRADLLKRQLSNSENYDKAILTLSTAALGLSFGLLKDFVPIEEARFAKSLLWSWLFFIGGIVGTLLSFHASQVAISKQLALAEAYYLHQNEGALKRSIVAKITEYLNYASGIFFALGVCFTTVYVYFNFEKATSMSKLTIRPGMIQNGATIPNMQKGAPIPTMQQVPAAPQPSSSPATATTPAASTTTSTGDTGK